MTSLLSTVLAFFVFPAAGFFLGLLALSVVYTIATETDSHGIAIFSTVLAIALYWATISVAVAAWHLLLIGILVYLVLGGVWSVYRWLNYCRKFIQEHPYTITVEEYSSGRRVLLTEEQYYKSELLPSKNRSRLIGWVAYWPWSLVWNITGDLLTTVYNLLVDIYKRTAERVIRQSLRN